MPLLARLRAYAAEAFGVAGRAEAADDTHLAATALLVHVARVDGILAPVEAERLAKLVQGPYAADAEAAAALVARASTFDAETRDIASLVEMMPHQMDEAERARLVAMAWTVAGADGVVGEFEEALVWRLGTLLGLDEAVVAQARDFGALDGAVPDRADAPR